MGYRIERFLNRFLSKEIPASPSKRHLILKNTNLEKHEINQDVFERQILRIFDFTAWVESQLRRVPMSEVLLQRL
ncbi:MAG: hypothetical protein MUC31_08595 [Bacteroidales bacterium]|nr:hypothetical protein [Bacteroidales bacterium]